MALFGVAGRKMTVAGWSVQMYTALVVAQSSVLDGMRCAPVLSSNVALEGLFRITGFESAGFDRENF
jgi:hypothetical protein